MDAVNFIKEWNRMCDTIADCDNCPLYNCGCGENFEHFPEESVYIVSAWSNANPIKTRQSQFLELFPHANLDKDGILEIYPCSLDKNYNSKCKNEDSSYISCENCRKEYWLEEII